MPQTSSSRAFLALTAAAVAVLLCLMVALIVPPTNLMSPNLALKADERSDFIGAESNNGAMSAASSSKRDPVLPAAARLSTAEWHGPMTELYYAALMKAADRGQLAAAQATAAGSVPGGCRGSNMAADASTSAAAATTAAAVGSAEIEMDRGGETAAGMRRDVAPARAEDDVTPCTRYPDLLSTASGSGPEQQFLARRMAAIESLRAEGVLGHKMRSLGDDEESKTTVVEGGDDNSEGSGKDVDDDDDASSPDSGGVASSLRREMTEQGSLQGVQSDHSSKAERKLAGVANNSPSVHIVLLKWPPPAALYAGGIEGLAATAAAFNVKGGRGAANAAKAAANVASADTVEAKIRQSAARAAANSAAGSSEGDDAAVAEYLKFLDDGQKRVLRNGVRKAAAAGGLSVRLSDASVAANTPEIIYSYKFALNGFAALLTPLQVSAIKSDPSVSSVSANQRGALQTTFTPRFLKLPQGAWSSLGGIQAAGNNVIVGCVDTGVWPEAFAFSNQTTVRYPPVPARWKGRCEKTADFKGCNGKIIGARSFYATFAASDFAIDFSVDYPSIRDSQGHGSMAASIIAGNYNDDAKMSGFSYGFKSGMAPRARLAIYKVSWRTQEDGEYIAGSFTADVTAGIDAAVGDKVDVLYVGVTKSSLPTLFDPNELALLNAARAGIFVAVPAGNYGRFLNLDDFFLGSMTRPSPWYTTVGAGTHTRKMRSQVVLGNGVVIVGESYVGAATQGAQAALVLGSAAAAAGAAGTTASFCGKRSLDPAKVRNKVVVCIRSYSPFPQDTLLASSTVKAAGGLGAIIINNAEAGQTLTPPVFHALPTVHVTSQTGQTVLNYIRRNAAPTSTVPQLLTYFNKTHPEVALFSSGGPNVDPAPNATGIGSVGDLNFVNDILKPDVVAPGDGIWATWTSSPTQDIRDAPSADLTPAGTALNVLSGTSIAAAHIAGIAALVVQKYPTWSPFAIKSAIQTTAYVTNAQNLPIRHGGGSFANPWDMGSGHVNGLKVLDPGLVFDESGVNMVRFLIGIDAVSASDGGLDLTIPENVRSPIRSYNLNLANIAVTRIRGPVNVIRRLKNVSAKSSTYSATLSIPRGVNLAISPQSFTIGPGMTQVVTISISRKVTYYTYQFGSIVWSDGTHSVRSILALQPSGYVAPSK